MAKPDPQITTRVRRVSFGALVRKIWGAEFNRPDKAYEFGNGKKFDSTDRDESGIYRRP